MFRVRVCMLFEANRLLFSSREETGNVVSYGSISMAIGKGLQPYVPSFVVWSLIEARVCLHYEMQNDLRAFLGSEAYPQIALEVRTKSQRVRMMQMTCKSYIHDGGCRRE